MAASECEQGQQALPCCISAQTDLSLPLGNPVAHAIMLLERKLVSKLSKVTLPALYCRYIMANARHF